MKVKKCEDYNRNTLAAFVETGYCIKTARTFRLDLIKCELVSSGSGIGTVAESCERCNRRAVTLTMRGFQEITYEFSRITLLHVANLVVCS
jgi:hypothetical protein